MTTCKYMVEADLPRRRGSCLCIEVGQPLPRCKLKLPDHWGGNVSAVRWLWSGGSPFVFGICTPGICPKSESA